MGGGKGESKKQRLIFQTWNRLSWQSWPKDDSNDEIFIADLFTLNTYPFNKVGGEIYPKGKLSWKNRYLWQIYLLCTA